MIPCSISGSGPRPRSLVDVIIIIIGIITVDGFIGVVGIVTHHHVFSPGQRWADSDLFLGLIGSVSLRLPKALVVMLAVRVASHEPLELRREARGAVGVGCRPGRLLLLLGLARGVRMSRVFVVNDGDRSRVHLLLRRPSPPRGLILCSVAQNAKNLPIVWPLKRLPESRPLLCLGFPLRVSNLQNENTKIEAGICVKTRAKYA